MRRVHAEVTAREAAEVTAREAAEVTAREAGTCRGCSQRVGGTCWGGGQGEGTWSAPAQTSGATQTSHDSHMTHCIQCILHHMIVT